MSASPANDSQRRAKLRGKRIALAIYGTFASTFVLISTWQLANGVFGITISPIVAATAATAPAPKGCADDIRAMRGALDRAFGVAVTAPDDGAALVSYRRALSPEWDGESAAADRCGGEPRGADAFAALRRLRVAQEASLRRQVVEMAPLRRDLAAYLP